MKRTIQITTRWDKVRKDWGETLELEPFTILKVFDDEPVLTVLYEELRTGDLLVFRHLVDGSLCLEFRGLPTPEQVIWLEGLVAKVHAELSALNRRLLALGYKPETINLNGIDQ